MAAPTARHVQELGQPRHHVGAKNFAGNTMSAMLSGPVAGPIVAGTAAAVDSGKRIGRITSAGSAGKYGASRA